MQIDLKKTSTPRTKPTSNLGFGKYFSDHMFLMDYDGGRWQRARIEPYGPLPIEPGASVLHYAQCLFEGMKAFRGKDGKVRLFRPEFNAERMAKGAERLCMPPVPKEDFIQAIEALTLVDADWVPTNRGASLYIRPTLVGTESYLGVRPANQYLFFVITSPVDAYYAEGFAPVKIWVEEHFIRAAPGGLGDVKAGANYACSLQASLRAKDKGYSQVLWLDANTHTHVEEVGTMNVFFRFKDKVVTPALDGTILNGGTRDCVLHVLEDFKIPVEERRISLDEVFRGAESGDLLEVFGTGTAAVISAVGELATEKKKVVLSGGKVGELTQRLFDEITAIQYGEKPDVHGWIQELG